jgi:hypothetical protein
MSLILPKGIVKNSDSVEASIERINQEPLDLADIAKFWKGTSAKPPVRCTLQPSGDFSTQQLNDWRTTGGAYGAAERKR